MFPRSMTVQGRSHRKGDARDPEGWRTPVACQDAVYTLESSNFNVLAVCDGLSDPLGEKGLGGPVTTQVGAGLLSRVAVHAVARHLNAGGGLDDVPQTIRQAIEPIYRMVFDLVGPMEFNRMMAATLVLGVMTDEGATIWAAGDGEAFISTENGELTAGTGDVQQVERGFLWSRVNGGEVGGTLVELVDDPSIDTPVKVMSVAGHVRGIYVATDGFGGEAKEARSLLQTDLSTTHRALSGVLTRTVAEHKPEQATEQIRRALKDAEQGQMARAITRLGSLTHPGMTSDDSAVAWAINVYGEGNPRKRRKSKRSEAEIINDHQSDMHKMNFAWNLGSVLFGEGSPRFTAKEDRQARHIAEGYLAKGYSEKDAMSIGYATVQRQRGEGLPSSNHEHWSAQVTRAVERYLKASKRGPGRETSEAREALAALVGEGGVVTAIESYRWEQEQEEERRARAEAEADWG